MNVSFSTEESEAVRNALRSYLRKLRYEISDTDNPGYKRGLRAEREALESAVGKLDQMAAAGAAAAADQPDANATLAIVELWWMAEEG